MARRRVVKTRFYALLAAVLIIIITVVVLVLSGGANSVLENGYIETKMEAKAVVIRDEECVSVEKYDRVLYALDEGATVNEGDVIGSVFKWGYTDERMQSLISVQKEILSEQRNILAGVANSSLAELDAKIEQKAAAARNMVMMGTEGDLLSIEKELDILLAQRKNLLKETVQPSEKLKQLYTEEEQQMAQLNEWCAEVGAVKQGRVSFYFDGYEQVLNAQKLSVINSELIANVMKNSGKSSTDNALLYRVVSPSLWYIAYVVDKESDQRTVAGAEYSLIFNGYESNVYNAVALEPIVEESKIVNILKVTQDIGDFMGIRSADVTLVSSANGIKISTAMLDMRTDGAFVNVVTGSGVKPMEVDILVSDGEHAIIKAKNTGDVLAAGMRCKKP